MVSAALTDPRAEGNALVHGEQGIRFYAAAPIVTADGHRLGTVNVLDTEPRTPTDDQMAILTELAAIAMDELERRLSAVTTVRSERTQRDRAERDLKSVEDYVSVLQRTLLEPDPDDPGFHITLATGGHPPALLLDPDVGQVTHLRSSSGMLVGAIADATFDACGVRLRPGQILLLYSDGITEARPDGSTLFGEEGLTAFLSGLIGSAAAEVVDRLAELIPTLTPDDDVALLALTAQ